MDKESDYIELHRLLAKCKFSLVRECMDLCTRGFSKREKYYNEKIKQIDDFIVDIPIIIKGDER